MCAEDMNVVKQMTKGFLEDVFVECKQKIKRENSEVNEGEKDKKEDLLLKQCTENFVNNIIESSQQRMAIDALQRENDEKKKLQCLESELEKEKRKQVSQQEYEGNNNNDDNNNQENQ